MIREYYRPQSVEEALTLFSTATHPVYPLGGGTRISHQQAGEDIAVMDLQSLGLDTIQFQDQTLVVGAAARLSDFEQVVELSPALRIAIKREATYNLRQMATLAGTVVVGDGRSTLVAALLALDAHLTWAKNQHTVRLEDYLPLRKKQNATDLILGVSFSRTPSLQIEIISRTPADRPVALAAIGRWPDGRTRVVLGGWGEAPLVVWDQTGALGAVEAAKAAYLHAGDQWASAEYRSQMAGTLVERLLSA